MADNNFGIEDSFAETEKVNDILFSDTDPNELEDIKEKTEKEKKEAEAKKAQQATPPKKAQSPKAQVVTEDEEEEKPIEDVNEVLFTDDDDDEEEEDDEEKPTKEAKPKVEGKAKTASEEEEGDDEEETTDNQFEILSKELYNIGVFAPTIDEESDEETMPLAKTPEEFKRLFEYQQQIGMYNMLDNHLSKFGPDRLELFDAIFNKGVDPKEYLPIYNEIENFENLTLDTEAAQEKVVREAYKRQNFADEKIDKKIQRLKDLGELESEAEDLKDMLIKQDKATLAKKQEEAVAQQKLEEQKEVQYKNSLINILNQKIKEKEFDGLPMNEKVARQAFDFLYNKKWQDAQGKKFTDFDKFILELNKPENHALKVKAGLLAMENFDLSKVQKKAVSKESSELFKQLAQKKSKQSSKKAEPAATWNL